MQTSSAEYYIRFTRQLENFFMKNSSDRLINIF